MVTDGNAEIICAFPHPNRQAGNFRPRENKLACFTHSSQSRRVRGKGGRDRQADRRRVKHWTWQKGEGIAEIDRWLCSRENHRKRVIVAKLWEKTNKKEGINEMWKEIRVPILLLVVHVPTVASPDLIAWVGVRSEQQFSTRLLSDLRNNNK